MNHGSASCSKPLLDLNLKPMEVDGLRAPPAEPAAPRRQQSELAMASAVQCIFRKYASRREALIRAITTDEEELFRKCDPSLEPLHLYGNTDGSWEVREPEFGMLPRQPEPAPGINLERDKMERAQWLQQIARHCDAWLISVSFFAAAELLNSGGREHLFSSINSLQTVYEAFMTSDTYWRLCQEKEERSIAADEDENIEDDDIDNDDDYEDVQNMNDSEEDGDDSKDIEDNNDSFCQLCGDRYHANGFWISCDVCNGWFHGRCVKIKQDQAEHLEHYICPDCNYDNSGHDDE